MGFLAWWRPARPDEQRVQGSGEMSLGEFNSLVGSFENAECVEGPLPGPNGVLNLFMAHRGERRHDYGPG